MKIILILALAAAFPKLAFAATAACTVTTVAGSNASQSIALPTGNLSSMGADVVTLQNARFTVGSMTNPMDGLPYLAVSWTPTDDASKKAGIYPSSALALMQKGATATLVKWSSDDFVAVTCAVQ